MFASKRFLCTGVMIWAMSVALPAWAQDTDREEDVQRVRPVVVSASGFEQDIRDAPASISIITREELENQPFNNLADALRDVPGVNYVGSGGNERDITIRGLPADYTLILVDGKRQGSRAARPNGSGGFEASWIPPLSAIERIEVIRGPMSTLYGSDAMGGVINIITRKPTQEWHGSIGFDYTLQEHGSSGDMSNANFYLGGPAIKDKLALQIWGNGHWRQEDHIPDGYSGQQNYNFTGRLLYTPVENHEFSVEYGQMLQRRETTPGKSQVSVAGYNTPNAPYTKSWSRHTREHWSLGWDANWDVALSKFNLHKETVKRITESEIENPVDGSWTGSFSDRQPRINNTTFDGSVTVPLPRNMVTFGGQYFLEELKDTSAGSDG